MSPRKGVQERKRCAVAGCPHGHRHMFSWMSQVCYDHDGDSLKRADCTKCQAPYFMKSFPLNDPDRLQEWIAFLGHGSRYKPNKDSRICSTHFDGGDENPSENSGLVLTRMTQKRVKREVVEPANVICTAEDQVTIEWKDHGQTLADGLFNMLKENYRVDGELVLRDERHRIHRLVLAIFLPTLKLRPKFNLDSLIADDGDIEKLIEFMYTGKLTVARAKVERFERLAKDLNFFGLTTAICQQCPIPVIKTEDMTINEFCHVVKEEQEDSMDQIDDQMEEYVQPGSFANTLIGCDPQ